MDEVKVKEEKLLTNGNGAVDSTSSDPVDKFLTPLPDPFAAQPEANPADQSSQTGKEEDSSSIPSKTSEGKPNDESSSNPPSTVRVHGDEDSLANADSSSGHKKGENSNHMEASGDVSPNVEKDGSAKQLEKSSSKVGHIDTAAPFESVKEAVSKFGGIVDWKAHRIQTKERRRYIEQELEKANVEIPVFKQKSEAAEQAMQQALKELDGTKRLIEELKLNLERAQTEERQAKQDSELAQLRVQEMEQGIADESSIAAKAQLEVARARHQAAEEELESVKSELEELRKDYDVLVSERDVAVKNGQEAVSASKEVERAVENLTIQLITTKKSIESTHAAHLEAEEHRNGEAAAQDQDALNWEKELKQAEEELEKVNQRIWLAKDLKSKLDTASVLLRSLKDELAVYMQGRTAEGSETNERHQSTRRDILAAVSVAKKNLEEVNQNIEKATEEIKRLKTAATSLHGELESEKAALTAITQQEGIAAEEVVSLGAELNRTRSELDSIRREEKEAREKLVELPKQLQKVTEEADHAKSLAEEARLELKKAKEAAEHAKGGASTVASRLVAAQKEIEAARTSERLALGAISALQESESARSLQIEEPKDGITLSLEEYYELSKKAHEAEEEANARVAEATSQIDIAKESEMQSLNKLTQLNSELAARKEALNVALNRAELAKESKLNVERELKKKKGQKEHRRKGKGGGGGDGHGGVVHSASPRSLDAQPASPSTLNYRPGVKALVPESNSNSAESSPDHKSSKKKKRNFLPRVFMFLGKKKPYPHKNA